MASQTVCCRDDHLHESCEGYLCASLLCDNFSLAFCTFYVTAHGFKQINRTETELAVDSGQMKISQGGAKHGHM